MGETPVYADVQGAPRSGAPHYRTRGSLSPQARGGSTKDYGPEEAHAAWVSLFSKHCHEVCSDSRWGAHPLRLRLEQQVLGSVRCSFLESNWQQISRSRAPVDDSNRHDFVLYQTRTGIAQLRLSQGLAILTRVRTSSGRLRRPDCDRFQRTRIQQQRSRHERDSKCTPGPGQRARDLFRGGAVLVAEAQQAHVHHGNRANNHAQGEHVHRLRDRKHPG